MELELTESLTEIARLAAEPFFAWHDHRSVLYWPFLLSALLLAIVVWISQTKPGLQPSAVGDLQSTLFARNIWWHKSARADYVYYVVNAILHGAFFGSLILSMDWVAVTTVRLLTDLFGTLPDQTNTGAAKLILTVLFFVSYDFGRFLAHFALHHIPALWIIHKVHHSAEVLTPITSMRAHPIELIWMASIPAITAGLPIGITIYIVGSDPGVVLLGGLHILIFAYSLIGNLRHSHVWLSYGVILNHIFISPAQHQIHHSQRQDQFGKNVGYALALWDWLFGTLYVPRERETVPLGLGDGSDAAYHSLRGMYLKPLVDYVLLIAPRAQ